MDEAIDKRTKAARALGRINHTSLHCTLCTVCLLHLQISPKSPNFTPDIGIEIIKNIAKGQLISKCLFSKIPPKNLIDSAPQYFRAESIKFLGGILVQTIFSKRHFEIN